MPSSLCCCSEDCSCARKQQCTNDRGHQPSKITKTGILRQVEFFFRSWSDNFFEPLCSSNGLQPVDPTCSSWIELPCLRLFESLCFPVPSMLRYFLDLKTPGSPGSVAAHQTYRKKTHATWQ